MDIGRIDILGSGSWATALAKISLESTPEINWYVRRDDQVQCFKATGYNPNYLSSAAFDTDRITFYIGGSINPFFRNSGTIILVTPSPYIKRYLKKMKRSSIRGKLVINAVKGVASDENLLVSGSLIQEFSLSKKQIGVVSGPCHTEEVTQERRSYLTTGSYSSELVHLMADTPLCDYITCTTPDDMVGIKFASVLKNIYAITAGICNGLNYEDNFQSVLISNTIAEMNSSVNTVCLLNYCVITNSVYLGDLLVTTYFNYSRNRTFDTMIGKGYSVKVAQVEMEMAVEGHCEAKCVREPNTTRYRVNMPIMGAVCEILYNKQSAKETIGRFSLRFR